MANDYKSGLARYRRYLQTVREKPLLGASLWVIMTLGLIIVMVLTALRPTLTTIAELLGQIEQREEMTVKLDEKITGLQKVSALLTKHKDDFVLLDEALPTEPRWEVLAGDLMLMASASGVKVKELTWGTIPVSGEKPPEKADSKKVVSPIPPGTEGVRFSLTCEGEYAQMDRLIGLVENGKRLVKITNITINKSKEVLNITIEGLAMYAKEVSL